MEWRSPCAFRKLNLRDSLKVLRTRAFRYLYGLSDARDSMHMLRKPWENHHDDERYYLCRIVGCVERGLCRATLTHKPAKRPRRPARPVPLNLSLTAVPDEKAFRYSRELGLRVARELGAISIIAASASRPSPRAIVHPLIQSDNAPVFAAIALREWIATMDTKAAYMHHFASFVPLSSTFPPFATHLL